MFCKIECFRRCKVVNDDVKVTYGFIQYNLNVNCRLQYLVVSNILKKNIIKTFCKYLLIK